MRNKASVEIKRNVSFVKKYQERPEEEAKIDFEAELQEQGGKEAEDEESRATDP